MATWNLSKTKHHLLICNGGSCNKAGAEEFTQALRNEISHRQLDNLIHTTRTKCNGRCEDKCVLIVYPQGTWYKDMNPTDVGALLDSLCGNKEFPEKISHQYDGEGFKHTENTKVGEEKKIAKVKKVSKTF